MKILAVDDDPVALEILSVTLTRANYLDLTLAASGAEALKILQNTEVPFDCCLLDILMPGIDGIELCAKIREMPEYKHAPIVMITALTDQNSIDQAYCAGATDFVSKPFNGLDLGARIRAAEILSNRVREYAQVVEQMKQTQARFHNSMAESDALLRLENAVLRASEKGFSNYVIALEITGVDYDAAHSELSKDMCKLITEVVGSAVTKIAYDGESRFLLTTARPTKLTQNLEKTLLSRALEMLENEFDTALTGEIAIRSGNSIKISTFDVSSRLDCISQARDSVREKAMQVQGDLAIHTMRPSVSGLKIGGDTGEMVTSDALMTLSRPRARGSRNPIKRLCRTALAGLLS